MAQTTDLYYHVAPVAAREKIQAQGLCHNARRRHTLSGPGVHLWGSLSGVKHYLKTQFAHTPVGSSGAMIPGEAADIWTVDPSAIKDILPDPYRMERPDLDVYQEAWAVPHTIKPEHLKIYATFHPDDQQR